MPVRAVFLAVLFLLSVWPSIATAVDEEQVRSRAERSFDRLKQQGADKAAVQSPPPAFPQPRGEDTPLYASDRYLIGKGEGDMSKGRLVCQRVSELSARTDLAKQIRILVKEHMVDRVRERSGRDAEQDIEITREELVQEFLQGVTIVDRQIDEEKKLCTATAVMPKSQIQPKAVPEQAGSISDVGR
ncbi:MAG TPA: hypothetical protein VFS39_04320 [Nitrospira sp.]|nr:hypothetical protein [Nitrospira sp.]